MLVDKTLLNRKYKRIILGFSELTGIDVDKVTNMFYDSDIYRQMSQGVADVHCQSDGWLIQEFLDEYKGGD